MLDIIIVGIYLFASLMIGLWSSKNINSFRDYAVSDRNYPLTIMVATISAAWIGGGTIIGLTEKIYEVGIIFFFIFLGDFFCKIFNSNFIAPKIGKFYGLVSSGDIMEKSYGKNSKIITGICSVFLSIGVISTQISAMSYFLSDFLHISRLTAISLGFGIIIIYSTAGGIKSVTFTDLVQFFVLFIGLPIIVIYLMNKIGGIEAFLAKIPKEKWQFSQKNHNIENINSFLLFSLAVSSPVLTQRLLMSKTPAQARRSMNIAALLDIPIYFIIALIGMIGFAINQNVSPPNIFPYLIDNMLPTGIRGIAIAVLLAAIMSTADSFLNSASISFVQDIIKPIMNNKITDKSSLYLAKIFTIFIGLFSIFIAYKAKSVYSLLFYTRIAWQPFIMVPFLAIIMGYDISPKSFYISIISSLIIIIIWEYFDLMKITKIYSMMVGTLTNLIFLSGSNFYFKKIAR